MRPAFDQICAHRHAPPRGCRSWRYTLLVILLTVCWLPVVRAADNVFIYSSLNTIRGINLTSATEYLLTTAQLAPAVNALALNSEQGIIYYGDQTSIYYWDPALGSTGNAHVLINNFANGTLQAPIDNLNSGSGSFVNGKYYVGSETDTGYIADIFELTMSADGRQVLSVTALNLLQACNCSQAQLGGFGDIAVVDEPGGIVIFGSTADISGNNSGTSAGLWRFEPGNNQWNLLGTGNGGQLANTPSGSIFTNVGNSIRTFNKVTGAVGGTSLFTTAAAIYDFSGGFNYDFGDAPDTYGAAYHQIPPVQSATVFLGTVAPDNEPYSLNTNVGAVNGQGDDSNGASDEDAFTSTQTMQVGDSAFSTSVACSVGDAVAAWLDVNLNGQFDTNERNANYPAICTAGVATLDWSSLYVPLSGDSFLRVRIASAAGDISKATGLAADGEVEDHPLLIEQAAGPAGNCPAGSSSTIYSATDLPQNIGPNRNTYTYSTITVPSSVVITDINLPNVSGQHTYINDLIFDLQRNGTNVRLYGPSCGSQNNFDFGFDDEANGSPPCPPTSGDLYPPTGSLAQFDTQDAIGDWTLRIRDRFNQDGGVLNNWSLEVCSQSGGTGSNPDIRVGKSASVDGSTVSITLLVKNTGNVDLDTVDLADNLDDTFGAGNYVLTLPPQLISSPAGFAINPLFDGTAANASILTGAAVLPPQQTLSVLLTVDVLPNSTQTNYSNQADVQAQAPDGSVVTDLSGAGLDITIDFDNPTLIVMQNSIQLSGEVFIDTSAAVGDSHDGIRQIGEPGLGGIQITVLDVASGLEIASSVTTIDGRWMLAVDAVYASQPLEIVIGTSDEYQSISEAPAYTSGAVSDGQIQLVPAAAQVLDGIDFGVVEQPLLLVGRELTVDRGASVRYTHSYAATTHGAVDFAASTSISDTGWSQRLVEDTNCNGLIDSVDAELTGQMSVAPGQRICLILDLYIPTTAVAGMLQISELTANLTVSDASGTGHAVVLLSTNTDLTRIAEQAAGQLVLTKSVRNISTGGPDTTSNTALPGHTLEYTINYSNSGLGAVTDLVINDQAPAFSVIDANTVSCGQVPALLNCTSILDSDRIQWDFAGSLESGASGNVFYRVTID